MNNHNYAKILSNNICTLRKQHGLTQEALAAQLAVSFQAVSKWENELTSPDIQLLPQLADIFQVSIDTLFGIQAKPQPAAAPASDVPWEHDDTLRAVIYKGRQLLQSSNETDPHFSFTYHGQALNVESHCSITCSTIQGDAVAGINIQCGDTDSTNGSIGGNARAGVNINCGSINGNVSAGCDITCGDIEASELKISSGCDIISGNIQADSGHVEIKGDLHGEQVSCETLSISGDVECRTIVANHATIHGEVSCSDEQCCKS